MARVGDFGPSRLRALSSRSRNAWCLFFAGLAQLCLCRETKCDAVGNVVRVKPSSISVLGVARLGLRGTRLVYARVTAWLKNV